MWLKVVGGIFVRLRLLLKTANSHFNKQTLSLSNFLLKMNFGKFQPQCYITLLLLLYRGSQLRFVLAPGSTVASEALVPRGTLGSQLEVCPQGGSIVEHISAVLAERGGCALIVDYGEDGSTRHTLRVSHTPLLESTDNIQNINAH